MYIRLFLYLAIHTEYIDNNDLYSEILAVYPSSASRWYSYYNLNLTLLIFNHRINLPLKIFYLQIKYLSHYTYSLHKILTSLSIFDCIYHPWIFINYSFNASTGAMIVGTTLKLDTVWIPLSQLHHWNLLIQFSTVSPIEVNPNVDSDLRFPLIFWNITVETSNDHVLYCSSFLFSFK